MENILCPIEFRSKHFEQNKISDMLSLDIGGVLMLEYAKYLLKEQSKYLSECSNISQDKKLNSSEVLHLGNLFIDAIEKQLI